MTTHQHKHSLDECSKILTQLNDFMDGDLAPGLCAELEMHLAECDNCRIVLDTLSKTLYLVRHLDDEPDELPNEVEQRLFAMLDLDDFLAGNSASD